MPLSQYAGFDFKQVASGYGTLYIITESYNGITKIPGGIMHRDA